MHPVSLSCCITFKNIEKLLFHWEFSTTWLVHSYLSISKLFFPIEHGTVPFLKPTITICISSVCLYVSALIFHVVPVGITL